MPPKSSAADKAWPTMLTLRINFRNKTFSTSFETTQQLKKRCNCSLLVNINPSNQSAFESAFCQGVLVPDTFSARFVITSSTHVKKAKELCVHNPERTYEDAKMFRLWILRLATKLSTFCESDHSQDSSSVEQDYTLRPFKTGNVTKRTTYEDVRRLLESPLSPSERQDHGMGYVYILRSQIGFNTLAELKIGFSKYHPEHRSHELASCLALPEIISFTPYMPHAKRLESIIHTELQACRKVQLCPKCHHNHREWFTVSHVDSREIVTRWSQWLLRRPYQDGKLTDEWKDHLARTEPSDDDLSTANFWETTISAFPREESDLDVSRRIGKYLNECYWDNACERMGIGLLGKEFKDEIRGDLRQMLGTHDGISISALQAQLLELADKLREYKEKSENGNRGTNSNDRPFFEDLIRPEMRGVSVHPDMTIGSLLRPNIPWIDRQVHPDTPLSLLINPDKTPGPLTVLTKRQRDDDEASRKDDWILKAFDSLKNIKTGAMSVSDPVLGISESPLGDATLLPVLALNDLKYLDAPVSNWVGMNPTNAGFQRLQEAYQRGEWVGEPQFKLPKAFRRSGIKILDPKAAETSKQKFEQASKGRPSKKESKETATKEKKSGFDQNDSGQQCEFTRGPEGDKWTFSRPLDENFIREVNDLLEEMKIGGRAEVERRAANAFRHYGIPTGVDLTDEGDSSDSDSNCSISSPPSKNAARIKDPYPGSASPSKETLNPNSASSSREPPKRKPVAGLGGITAKKAKLWLDSL
ncbi:uncharacterized protein BDZ99DRAFT_250070 [Mytilinidion resinicola]|uniref:Bacteriophage T5 Orf172 DNA-binding domain-containing protein n=1 Tax=Mytilinidion resinicola TaxID=574789 RepID=A0A6A6YX77_9PEZI|nr:uncharacterized protein BDZ99DRAFT_250070 [Mytilinidion resinicola]KAF2813129.1 hypothetical protein BDZ99DRAFT_250070 [Mytilinidion resinicola]